MARERSQADLAREVCLARMSRWATSGLVIPLLTGLSFAVSTAFLDLLWGLVYEAEFFHLLVSEPWPLPWPVVPVVNLVLGFGLGFPLRWAMRRIRATGRPSAGIPVAVGVGLAWLFAGTVQIYLIFVLTV